MTQWIRGVMALSLAGLAAACSGDSGARASLERDELAWLDTVTFAPRSDAVVSELEAGLALEEAPAAVQKAAPKATSTPRAAPVRRASTTSTRTASADAPAPVRMERKENVARDAAIGAAGGAVIGAVVGGSGNRVKGAIIGGAVGAVAGAVVGKTIDVQERPVKQLASKN